MLSFAVVSGAGSAVQQHVHADWGCSTHHYQAVNTVRDSSYAVVPIIAVVHCVASEEAQLLLPQHLQPWPSLVASACLWLWRVLRVMVYSSCGVPVLAP